MAANHEKAGLGREPRRAESRNKHCEKGGVVWESWKIGHPKPVGR